MLSIVFYIFLKKKKIVKSKHKLYKNLNLSFLINEEIESNKNYYSAVIGILNFKFFSKAGKK